jgi:hypothetical protein
MSRLKVLGYPKFNTLSFWMHTGNKVSDLNSKIPKNKYKKGWFKWEI